MYVDGVSRTPSTEVLFSKSGTHEVSIVFNPDIKTLYNKFSECVNLTSVDWTNFGSSSLQDVSFMFNGCTALEQMTGFGSVNFEKISDGSTGIIIGHNTGTTGMFQQCSSLKEIVIPDTLKYMNSFMFNHCPGANNTEIRIPASVIKIGGSHAFYNCGKDNVFTQFTVDANNTAFRTIDGILYTIDGTELVSVPRSPLLAERVYEMPEGVIKLGELCFNRTQTIDKVILANSYVIDRYCNGQRNNTGINYGNSLSVAIYQYTSIKEYALKSGNVKYTAHDGCIYSADGTELIAVPYRKSGSLSVHEGCTTIGKEAFWEAGDVTPQPNMSSIHIPSSVTSIEPSQLGLLNRFLAIGKSVTIDAANTKYKIVNNAVVSM